MRRGRTRPNQNSDYGRLAFPMAQSDLCGFLDLIGFYRKFIKGFATVVVLLTTLPWKDNFQWHQDAQLAFDKIK